MEREGQIWSARNKKVIGRDLKIEDEGFRHLNLHCATSFRKVYWKIGPNQSCACKVNVGLARFDVKASKFAVY